MQALKFGNFTQTRFARNLWCFRRIACRATAQPRAPTTHMALPQPSRLHYSFSLTDWSFCSDELALSRRSSILIEVDTRPAPDWNGAS